MTRTSTPSAIFRSSNVAICIPTEPSRQPNMRMWTDDCAPSMSLKMRGKKFAPSTHGSIVAAVDHAKSSAASCGRVPLRAANSLVAASAPAGVTASGGGGQLGFWVTPSTCLYTRTNRAAATSATTARPWRPRFRAAVLASSRIAEGSYRPRRGGISRGVGCVHRRRRRSAGCVPDVDEFRERRASMGRRARTTGGSSSSSGSSRSASSA